MHTKGPLAFASSALALSSTNLTTSVVNNGLSAPQGWASIDLVGLAAEGLTKRTAMTYCANQDSAPGNCAPTSEQLSGTLAALLKRNADSNTCRTSTGSANGVSWSFIATPDGNCKTTAQESTIQGGLNRYFSYLGNQICGVHCVRLDHSGTYNAYISLGPTGADLGSVACGADGTYVDCGNGGDNDA